jgi:protein-disulfide isomerase
MRENSEVVKLLIPVSDQDHVRGPAGAPVTLVEYGDYECPYCDRANLMIRKLQRQLGDKLRFVFRHFPMAHVHPYALRAAEAAETAASQGKFWEMHDYLFKHQDALDERSLARYARKLGLDMENFNREMTEGTHAARVREDYSKALFGGGVTGIPTFYINGVLHSNSDFERMLAAIERALAEVQGGLV